MKSFSVRGVGWSLRTARWDNRSLLIGTDSLGYVSIMIGNGIRRYNLDKSDYENTESIIVFMLSLYV